MKIEKVLLAFFAVLGGLIVAGVAFYIYESTRTIPPSQVKTVQIVSPTPTATPVILTLTSPQDGSVTGNKIVTVSGQTTAGATLIVSTANGDEVITPASTGTFSTTVTIDSDENYIHILAIDPKGNEAEKTVTVTYSTQNF